MATSLQTLLLSQGKQTALTQIKYHSQ